MPFLSTPQLLQGRTCKIFQGSIINKQILTRKSIKTFYNYILSFRNNENIYFYHVCFNGHFTVWERQNGKDNNRNVLFYLEISLFTISFFFGWRNKYWEINYGQWDKTVHIQLPKAMSVCGLYHSVPQSPQWTRGPKDSPKAALRPPLSTKTELIRKLIASPEGMRLQTLSYTPCWGNLGTNWCTVINSA